MVAAGTESTFNGPKCDFQAEQNSDVAKLYSYCPRIFKLHILA